MSTTPCPVAGTSVVSCWRRRRTLTRAPVPPQIDNPERGFTFKWEGPLDLRMNNSKGLPAAAMLAKWAKLGPQVIEKMLVANADEEHAARIARAVCAAAGRGAPPATTTALAQLVRGALGDLRQGPPSQAVAPRRVFAFHSALLCRVQALSPARLDLTFRPMVSTGCQRPTSTKPSPARSRRCESHHTIQNRLPLLAAHALSVPPDRLTLTAASVASLPQIRIEVNDEFGALDALLAVLPQLLRPGGRAAVLTFHSGEDRRVKHAFRDGQRAGIYSEASDVIRPSFEEQRSNPRSACAKLRVAVRSEAPLQW